ncbi:protein kinase family protein [Opitutus terrae]|uniref:Serine/threonine protein kinase n=1 Tax=Opitutus terrae (strain DSM 11246 / JCM 15787 / PB90-1) TaxID=452637 RepID=B1ZP27_OPITP|nr:protein kinase family protein [Opitutus terrae]ACB77513.1 serine/threonine protein kinase [Opitutus terrae PB90-1]
MPEPEARTVDADHPPVTALPDAAAMPFLQPDGNEAVPGQRWNRFTLGGVFPGARHSYLAEDVGKMEKVLITARLVTQGIEWRRRAWAQLCAMEQTKVLRCLDAFEENGWRYEVMAAPPSTTVAEWLSAHRPRFDELEALVQQVAGTLDALHADGLVHLNLQPESLHIEEGANGPEFVVGGLQEVTLFQQPELIPIEVDPFYAPPEAAGLARHSPGPQLCAWDWWSLGRVIQEVLLGQHVVMFLLKRTGPRTAPELRQRAEQLLLEREPAGARAGAVEETGAEPAALPLLRGLLTGSMDARWRGDMVQRWLRHENVRDYYDQPRNVRLWRSGGRVFTLPDAAEYFTQAPTWAAGETTLLEPYQPDTLAHFLRETPAHRADWDRLRAVTELANSPAWAEVPELARRTLIVGISWLALAAGAGGRANLRVRGCAMETAGLLELLKNPGGAEGVAIVRGLLHPPLIEYVESLDPVAARVLKGLAARAGAALKIVLEAGWLDDGDHAGFVRLFSLAVQRMNALQERVTALQSTYATSRYPELARMLNSKTATPVEQIVLAFTGQTPEQCGFITHADSRNERYHALRTELDAISGALRWVRLYELLRRSRLWGAPWPLFGTAVAAVAALLAVLDRSGTPAIVATAALIGSRAWLWWRVQRTMHRYDHVAGPWLWSDGTERAASETARVLAKGKVHPTELMQQAVGLRVAMAEFSAEARRSPPAPDPHWWDVAASFVLGGLITVGALVHSLAGVREALQAAQPPALAAESSRLTAEVRSRLENADRSLSKEVVTDPQALLATGRYELIDDGFGRRLRGPLQRWDRYAPTGVASLKVLARAKALPEQSAFAVVTATLQLRPYMRDSVKALLAIRVPTARGTGVMIYNARDRGLLDREVRMVRGGLREDTWYELDGRRVLFLGNPVPLETTNSLAPP